MPSVSELVRTYAKSRKERLREHATHALLVIRNGRVAAVVSHPDVEPLLAQAELAGAAYGADALALLVEGVVPVVTENPQTGRPWQSGEAEQLWREADGIQRGWVSEVLLIAVGYRDETVAEETWLFRLAAESVDWENEPRKPSSGSLAAGLVARLKRATLDPARVPNPGDGMVGDAVNGPFYELDEGRISLDIGFTRILAGRLEGGEAILVVESEERAADLVSKGLPRWQAEVY